MKKSKIEFLLKLAFYLGSLLILAILLVHFSPIEDLPIFETGSLFTYLGVLMGFALTIYTFGIAIATNIRAGIIAAFKNDKEKSDRLYNDLLGAFRDLKEDIWSIFISILLIVFFGILKEIPNPFGLNPESMKIPEIAKIFLFGVSTLSIWDLTKTLFVLAEIQLNLPPSPPPSS